VLSIQDDSDDVSELDAVTEDVVAVVTEDSEDVGEGKAFVDHVDVSQ